MGTKENPSKFDPTPLPDEPTFTLLARDPDFARLVRLWATRRQQDIACGERPASDSDMVAEAFNVATDGETWRRENMGAWRKKAS